MEHLSMNLERRNQQEEQSIQWRRDRVLELSSQGHSQREISTMLQIGIGTVKRFIVSKRTIQAENKKIH